MNALFLAHAWRRAAAATLIAIVAACGGGGVGSGGTGGPVGLSVGTVSGLGSVIVDGVRFDTRSAFAVAETSPGIDSPADVRLGDHVELAFEQPGVASALRVEAAVIGAVTSVGATQFVALGQTIQVNTDATLGPVTQLGGGLASLSDLLLGDFVEVHGVVLLPGILRATRVERLAAAPAYLRVTGLVSELGTASASVFKLGALVVQAANATIVPGGASLANGELVRVMAPAAALSNGLELAAAQVRIKALPHDADDAYLGGAISNLDTTAHTFRIGDVTVSYGAATVSPSGTSLANGRYVRVRGSIAADGTLVSSSVTLRDGHTETEGELHGNISAYDAATKTFVVRDVTVDASSTSLQIEGCSSGLADGLYVEVQGRLSATRLIATQIECASEPSGATIEREGSAGAVDAAAKTFTLTKDSSSITVSWSAQTYFEQLTPDTLTGQPLKVTGVFVGSVLNAVKIEPHD